MKLNILSRAAAIATAVSAAGMVSAATVDPADFDSIFTEGLRTETVDGADVSGNAAVSGNGNIGNFLIPNDGNTLLVGRVTNTGSDSYTASAVTGFATITVLNYASSSRGGGPLFNSTFEFFANGTAFGDQNGGSYNFTGEDLQIVVTSVEGATDYDIGVQIAAVPLPAAGFLLLGALGGVGALRRRK